MLNVVVLGNSERAEVLLKILGKLPGIRVQAAEDGAGADLVIHADAGGVWCPSGEDCAREKLGELVWRLVDKLRQAQELNQGLSAILDSVEEGIQVVDAQGVTTYINPAGVRILGLPPNKVIGRSVFKYSPDGSLVRVLTTGQSVFGVFNRPLDTDAYVVSNASPIIVDGKLVGAVATFRDVADIVALARDLKRRDVMQKGLVESIDLMRARYTFDDIKGSSEAMRRVVRTAQVAAKTDSTVLILGETGTGKELLAHAIHNASPRKKGPFIKVNCAAVPETLLESEFFGCEKGAYTGADRARPGKFELADGGTILLDEIGDMSPGLQAKLLRVLQDQEVQRLGSSKPIKVDVRIIASTSKHLHQMLASGAFRKDLYYRLSVINLVIPPLRARKEDIPELCEWLIYRLNSKLGRDICGITEGALELLKAHDWLGNVRELQNVLERAMVVCEGNLISEEHISLAPESFDAVSPAARMPYHTMNLREIEKEMIRSALAQFGYSLAGKKKAAAALGISLATMYNKAKKYGLLNQ